MGRRLTTAELEMTDEREFIYPDPTNALDALKQMQDHDGNLTPEAAYVAVRHMIKKRYR